MRPGLLFLAPVLFPIVWWLGGASPLRAQTAFRVPDSPAFHWLSASPAKVTHPATARGLASSLATLVDSAGRFRQGFALEAAPWVWIPGVSIPVAEYGRLGKYMLANTTLSFGTASAEGGDSDTDMALGIRTTFFDAADPMRDPAFRAELGPMQSECGSDPDSDPDEVLQCVGDGTERARERWLKSRWNAGSLSAAFVTGLRFAESRIYDGRWAGLAGWLSGAVPLGGFGQLIGQVGYDARRPSTAANAARALSAGARAVFGSSWVNGFGELSVANNLDSATTDDTTANWSGGVEFRAASSLWLATGISSGFATDGEDRMVILANIRWRISETPRLSPN